VKFSWKILSEHVLEPLGINCFVIQLGEIRMQEDGTIGSWSTHPVYMLEGLIGVEQEIAL
jgi:hypothetical protein